MALPAAVAPFLRFARAAPKLQDVVVCWAHFGTLAALLAWRRSGAALPQPCADAGVVLDDIPSADDLELLILGAEIVCRGGRRPPTVDETLRETAKRFGAPVETVRRAVQLASEHTRLRWAVPDWRSHARG